MIPSVKNRAQKEIQKGKIKPQSHMPDTLKQLFTRLCINRERQQRLQAKETDLLERIEDLSRLLEDRPADHPIDGLVGEGV